MRILHVITTINLGGAENHLKDLSIAQKKLGHEVKIAYLKGDHFWKKHLEENGVETQAIEMTSYADFGAISRINKIISDFQPDVVHAHMPPAELFTRIALGGSKLPFVVSKHNDERFAPIKGEKYLANWCAKRADQIIAISDAVNKYISTNIKHSSDKIKTIHYGLDPERFETVDPKRISENRAQWGIEDGEVVYGTVARLVPQKSLHTLLEAFSKLSQSKDVKAKLVIVGDGPLESELKDLAQSLGIQDRVVWPGRRSDIEVVMKSFDVFVLPSIYEGFGLVLLEAMAASLPIIASKVSAIPEIIVHETTGLLCEAQNVENFSSALEQLADSSKRESFGSNGLGHLRQSFVTEKMVDQTLGIYNSISRKQ